MVGGLMKTINANKDKELEIFIDTNTNEYLGFAGWITVDDESIYVDTRDGSGYDRVIAKMTKLIKYLAAKYKFSGFTFEDAKQHVSLHIIEGMSKFDPRKEIKLSTFLQMRINRRLINEIRDDSRFYRNATMLNIQSFTVNCSCGSIFSLSLNSDEEIADKNCSECGANLANASKRAVSQTELPIDSALELSDDTYSPNTENMIKNTNIFGDPKDISEDHIIARHDFKEWLKDEDPRMIKVIELICFHDYSIKEAAAEAGISNAGANIRLKNLRKNRKIKEMLGL